MFQGIFNINPIRLAPRSLDAFAKVLGQAYERRFRFVTPELLLVEICRQPEFARYVERCNKRAVMLGPEVMACVMGQERVSPYEEYGLELSPEMRSLCEAVGELDCTRVYPSDIIGLLLKMEGTEAHVFVERFLGGDVDDVVGKLRGFYVSEGDEGAAPRFVATAIMGGRPLGVLGGDVLDRLLKESGLLNAVSQGEEVQAVNRGVNVSAQTAAGGAAEESEAWKGYVTDLTERYEGCRPLVGREVELERTVRCLCRKDRHHVVFVGESGVGKSAMVRGLAQLLCKYSDMPLDVAGCRIYEVDMGALLAGSSFHGEFERRLKMVFEGAIRDCGAVLYFDDFQNVMVPTGGGNGSMTVANIMKPYLDSEDLYVVGSMTYRDWNRFIVPDKGMVSRFEKVDIKEMSVEDTVRILSSGGLAEYESHHGVKYTPGAVRFAVEQCVAHIHDGFLPGKAVTILDEAGVYRSFNRLRNREGEVMKPRYQRVDEDVVRIVLSDVCGIDVKAISAGNAEGLLNLNERIRADIYGQDAAVDSVVNSILMSRAGLSDPEKPMASLLFVGPTGVGKTELCRKLAQEMGVELVRFDMSEYTEKHTVSKMIGSPAGYVGYDEGGLLTDAVRKSPNCVLLLDEIEKAHADIYNILLQVMDYGRLTDSRGNGVDFRGVILVMTSNAGAQFASQASVGFGGGVSRGEAMQHQLKRLFKPEFLNRLTSTVVFNDMDREMASMILDKKLRLLGERLEKRGVVMELCPEAHSYLLSKGFNPTYGAREMDRVITRELTPLLMREILFGGLRRGGRAEVVLGSGDSLSLRCGR